METSHNWTEAQTHAIFDIAPQILVSAAAGSGKTSVLTQRIVERLLDENDPLDITRVLVVTFTRAAASELRQRLAKALRDAMLTKPSMKKRLKRQLMLLDNAQISTIHSFCLRVIRSHAQSLSLPASSRVAEEQQIRFLKQAVMEDVVETYYEAAPEECDIPDFCAFTDTFVSLRDDRLPAGLLSLYDALSSCPDGLSFLKRSEETMRDAAGKEFGQTVLSPFLSRLIDETFSTYESVYSASCRLIASNETYAPYDDAFASDFHLIRSVLSEKDPGKKLMLILSYEFPKLGTVKAKDKTEELLRCAKFRDAFKEEVKKLRTHYGSLDGVDAKETLLHSADFARDLYAILSAFEKRYTSEKRRRSLLDFTDLERLTMTLLWQDGHPSECAEELARQYDEVLIDEYQDTNDLQDRIFASFTSAMNAEGKKGVSCFMVGDSKQSIYSFRGAEPSLFASYRQNPSVHTIFLQHNFRCDRPIITFVNDVCGFLLKNASDMPYREEDDLVCGKEGDGDSPLPEVVILPKKAEDDTVSLIQEASYVARRIEAALEEGFKPGEIAVLLRNKNAMPLFLQELTNRNIPCFGSESDGLLAEPEVLLTLSLLHAVDNPTHDIYLAGALKSPVFGFTLSELIRIRRSCPEGTLYEAVKMMAGTEGEAGEKCGRFLERLSRYREKAQAQPADRFLSYLYEDTALFSILSHGADASVKQANLLLLYEQARQIESTSFHGLHAFLDAMDRLSESQTKLGSAQAQGEGADAVRLLSIHHAKGLEYPVVFVSDCGRMMNRDSKRDKVMIDRKFGIAPCIPDATGMAQYESFLRHLMMEKQESDQIAEELRILYVALTRAKKRLIVTGSANDPEKMVTEIREQAEAAGNACRAMLKKSPSLLHWLLYAIFACKVTSCRLTTIRETDSEKRDDAEDAILMDDEWEERHAASDETTPEIDREELCHVREELKRRLSFVYPGQALTVLPAKLSVSDLSPSVLDVGENAGSLTEEAITQMRAPRFLTDTEENRDGALIGTATHLFLQFCDFDHVDQRGVRAEKERLLQCGYLSEAEAGRVDMRLLNRFFDGTLYRAIREAKQVWRELRFNCKFPASLFTREEEVRQSLRGEEILVQGVMDCVFLNADGTLTVADYKTDRIPYEMRGDPMAFERLLTERHGRQLGYYKLACETMFAKTVSSLLLYSFSLGRTVTLEETALTGERSRQ